MKKTFVLTFIVLAFVLLFLLFGCISNMAEYSSVYGDAGKDAQGNRISFFDPNQRKLEAPSPSCTFGPCACFVCTKTTSFFNVFTSFRTDNPLQPVECKVNPDCKYKDYLEKLTVAPYELPNDDYLMNFMVGAPSSQFSQSNALCENRLDMTVKWVLGSNDRNYETIDAERATCYLDIGVIPVYLLYTKPPKDSPRRSLNAGDVDAAKKIAEKLNGAGPVILTAEAEFDSSNANEVDAVKRQIVAMKTACPKCMIALAPKYLDTKGIDIILEDPSVVDNVDIIAFGINTDYSQTKCNAGSIFREAGEFSRYALYKYKKPSVITYMYFNPKKDTAGRPATPDKPRAIESCRWSDYDLSSLTGDNVYSTFFAPETISGFVKSGVLGASFYAYDKYEADPFYCKESVGVNDCAVGKSEDSIKSFFAACQRYKKIETQSLAGDPILKLNAGMKLLFPMAETATCSLSHQNNLISLILANTFTNKDITQTAVTEMRPKQEMSLSCDACANSDYTGVFPFNINKNGFADLNQKKAWCASSEDESNKARDAVPITTPLGNSVDYEAIGSMVDYYADKRDLDPYIIRANIVGESQYDKCEISYFLPLGAGGCNPLQVVTGEDGRPFTVESKGILDIDPAGEWGPNCNGNINTQFASDSGIPPQGIQKPTKEPCAYGIMQAIEYPTDLKDRLLMEAAGTSNEKIAYLSRRAGAGGAIRPLTVDEKNAITSTLTREPYATQMDECLGADGKYNPFNVEDSMCWGTLKLRLTLNAAIGLVQGHEREFSFVDDTDSTKIDDDKVRVAEYYIALSKYGGEWKDEWLTDDYKFYLNPDNANLWCDPGNADPMGTRGTDCGPVVDGKYTFKPDAICYGQKDFLKFMEKCIYPKKVNNGIPQADWRKDSALNKIKWYKTMTTPYAMNNELGTGCKHSTCPSPTLSGLYLQCKATRDPTNPAKSCWDDAKSECNEDCAFNAACARLTDPVTHASCFQGGRCIESCIAKNQGVVGAAGPQ